MRKKRAVNWENMMWSVLFVSMAGQLVIWIFADKYINFPRVELFFLAAYLFIKGTVKFKSVEKRKDFLLFTLLPLTAFLGVSIFTNHPFLASAPFLSYVIAGFVLQSEKEEKARQEEAEAKENAKNKSGKNSKGLLGGILGTVFGAVITSVTRSAGNTVAKSIFGSRAKGAAGSIAKQATSTAIRSLTRGILGNLLK